MEQRGVGLTSTPHAKGGKDVWTSFIRIPWKVRVLRLRNRCSWLIWRRIGPLLQAQEASSKRGFCQSQQGLFEGCFIGPGHRVWNGLCASHRHRALEYLRA